MPPSAVPRRRSRPSAPVASAPVRPARVATPPFPAVERAPARGRVPRAAAARAKRPGPAPGARRANPSADTRDLIFVAAANDFSTHGFDGVSVDAIAHQAGVNKAMIYYHFEGKLGLYREVVRDMLRAVGAAATEIADNADGPAAKIEGFIEALARLRDSRPWFPPLMMREMAAGAPGSTPTRSRT